MVRFALRATLFPAVRPSAVHINQLQTLRNSHLTCDLLNSPRPITALPSQISHPSSPHKLLPSRHAALGDLVHQAHPRPESDPLDPGQQLHPHVVVRAGREEARRRAPEGGIREAFGEGEERGVEEG